MKNSLLYLSRARRSENGSAVLVMLALLVLILMLCTATTRTVLSSRQEISLIEQRQVARLAAAATNAPSAAKPISVP
jgi:hypothetical protein